MSEVVAKRYADALFQLGIENHTQDQLVEQLKVVKRVFEENESLSPFLTNPRVDKEKKFQFVDQVFQGSAKEVINTLKLLVERHRVELVVDIVDSYVELVNQLKGTAEATVYSVRKLSETELAGLGHTFAKRYGKTTVHFTNVVDPTILGGMKIRMGNTILDGTILGKLKRIERNMKLANNG
ncbi:F0F1 ATP synthase subunit delta [Virgibacillus soli]|uniref:ATP synthase subunit delta n=1 Tax=Paracerasibacillus soli TaxID=480284 RepID=A0ABU5CT12_9BACI|nr:F0F1 ATP synthase subunit delta [Virgibacillus soli]MDY0409487.1 F0F1 ATP synthase subunit delta [Virgibacillus soli]